MKISQSKIVNGGITRICNTIKLQSQDSINDLIQEFEKLKKENNVSDLRFEPLFSQYDGIFLEFKSRRESTEEELAEESKKEIELKEKQIKETEEGIERLTKHIKKLKQEKNKAAKALKPKE